MKTALVWFRRDLRLADNPALQAALHNCERVVMVYIHSPSEESPWEPGAASRWWLHHSLAALQAALRRLGGNLLIAQGPTQATLTSMVRRFHVDEVHWNRLYEPATIQRDTKIKTGLSDVGVAVESHPGNLLFEPWQPTKKAGGPYRVFTPFWRWCRTRLPEQAPHAPPGRLTDFTVEAERETELAALGLEPKIPWHSDFRPMWTPGEIGAQAHLADFLSQALAGYEIGRDIPSTAGTSRLSPYLHFGEISPRQVLWSLRDALERQADFDSGHGGAERYLSEIGWREFAHHLLFHYPDTPDQPLNPRFVDFPWREGHELDLEAWQQGRTGIPIVDAGMRELWATGWMHNRVRMLDASFLTKNLRVQWVAGARWFWDTLVDADLASNTMGWQWVAGTGADAAPYYRIFNPVTQAERFDPEGRYIRRWIPELADQAPAVCHAPWVHGSPPSGYPPPLVDLKMSRQSALEAYQSVRG